MEPQEPQEQEVSGRMLAPSDTVVEARLAAPTRARYVTVAFTLVLSAICYLDRICISTAMPAIQKDLHLSDGEVGLVFSAFTFAYALCEMPSGWLTDRF